MASGDSLVEWTAGCFDGFASTANAPQFLVDFLGAPVLEYSLSDDAKFSSVLPQHYGGAGISVLLIWTTLATSGDVVWSVSFAPAHPSVIYSSVGFGTPTLATATTLGTNVLVYTTIPVSVANLNGITNNERFRIMVQRSPSGTQFASPAKLIHVYLRET